MSRPAYDTTHPWHRRSLRLRGYDYSQTGAYFITICAYRRACLFGEIADGVMRENRAGQAIHQAWDGLPSRFPDIELDAFIVMPNHVHGILVLADGRLHEHIGRIVGEFTSLTVQRYVRGVREEYWPRYIDGLWQRNYYEHVIRDEEILNRIREYIAGSPGQWADDPENPQGGRQM